MEVRRSELHSECVIELLHGDLSISVVVESSHQGVFFMISDEDVQTKQQVSVLRNERQFRQQLTRSQMKFCQLTLTFSKHIGFKRKN